MEVQNGEFGDGGQIISQLRAPTMEIQNGEFGDGGAIISQIDAHASPLTPFFAGSRVACGGVPWGAALIEYLREEAPDLASAGDGVLWLSAETFPFPLPVFPVPGMWGIPPGGRVPGGWYAPLPPPGVLAGAGLPARFLPYRPGGSHSGYSGFYWAGPAGLPLPPPLFAGPAAFLAWALASIQAEIADIGAFLGWLRQYLAAPKPATGYFGKPGQV
jgi:hypothetical protein